MAVARDTVLVTGAAGFIGRRIADALVARGHRVIGTDVHPPAQPTGFEVYQADVRDTTRHAPVVAGCDAIVHCGGISGPMVLADNPAEVVDINIRGTAGLLALARGVGLRRFVGLSSVSAYGNTGTRQVVDEDTPLTATNAYGTSKAASDLLIQSYAGNYGLSAAALRIGWVYGPGRVTDALIQPMVRSARGQPCDLAAGGDHALQFVHVEDVVSAALAALAVETLPSAVFNINGADMLTVRQMAAMIARHYPGVRITLGPGLLPDTDVQGRMDLTRAARDLGWTPAVDFAGGLAAYVDWLKAHPF
ncbi:MAG: NAD(P)-dependent oxidoreductase [Pseudomonadota bacterium]